MLGAEAEGDKPKCIRTSVRRNLPRQWDDRPTWIRFTFDTVYDPEIFFNIELHWLVASSVQIRQFLAEMKRAAKSNGLVIKQIPSQQVEKLKKLQDPFHMHATIQTRLEESAQKEILEDNGFIHDRNPSPQQYATWRHRSCCAVVRVDYPARRVGGATQLTWITNYLDPAHP